MATHEEPQDSAKTASSTTKMAACAISVTDGSVIASALHNFSDNSKATSFRDILMVKTTTTESFQCLNSPTLRNFKESHNDAQRETRDVSSDKPGRRQRRSLRSSKRFVLFPQRSSRARRATLTHVSGLSASLNRFAKRYVMHPIPESPDFASA